MNKLNIKEIRSNNNTKIVSTEEALKDIEPFFREEDQSVINSKFEKARKKSARRFKNVYERLAEIVNKESE